MVDAEPARNSLRGAGSVATAGGCGNLQGSLWPRARPLRAAQPAGDPRPPCAVLPLVALEIEEIGRLHRLVREAPARGRDGRNATPGRFHPPHPNTQQMLAAVARLSREMRWLDPSTLDECFQSSGHVQYHAQYR